MNQQGFEEYSYFAYGRKNGTSNMSDTLSPAQRHKCMSHIRSKNTKPEVRLRKELFRLGYRYRINKKGLIGSPIVDLERIEGVTLDGEQLRYVRQHPIDWRVRRTSSTGRMTISLHW